MYPDFISGRARLQAEPGLSGPRAAALSGVTGRASYAACTRTRGRRDFGRVRDGPLDDASARSVPVCKFDYLCWNVWMMMMTAGPIRTMNRVGKMQPIIGKSIFSGA